MPSTIKDSDYWCASVTKLVGSHHLMPIGNNSGDRIWWKGK